MNLQAVLAGNNVMKLSSNFKQNLRDIDLSLSVKNSKKSDMQSHSSQSKLHLWPRQLVSSVPGVRDVQGSRSCHKLQRALKTNWDDIFETQVRGTGASAFSWSKNGQGDKSQLLDSEKREEEQRRSSSKESDRLQRGKAGLAKKQRSNSGILEQGGSSARQRERSSGPSQENEGANEENNGSPEDTRVYSHPGPLQLLAELGAQSPVQATLKTTKARNESVEKMNRIQKMLSENVHRHSGASFPQLRKSKTRNDHPAGSTGPTQFWIMDPPRLSHQAHTTAMSSSQRKLMNTASFTQPSPSEHPALSQH